MRAEGQIRLRDAVVITVLEAKGDRVKIRYVVGDDPPGEQWIFVGDSWKAKLVVAVR